MLRSLFTIMSNRVGLGRPAVCFVTAASPAYASKLRLCAHLMSCPVEDGGNLWGNATEAGAKEKLFKVDADSSSQLTVVDATKSSSSAVWDASKIAP